MNECFYVACFHVLQDDDLCTLSLSPLKDVVYIVYAFHISTTTEAQSSTQRRLQVLTPMTLGQL